MDFRHARGAGEDDLMGDGIRRVVALQIPFELVSAEIFERVKKGGTDIVPGMERLEVIGRFRIQEGWHESVVGSGRSIAGVGNPRCQKSRRDFAPKPRVASRRATLGNWISEPPNPNGVAPRM